jgi:uncharacterized membrane protein YhaH (DUF805 family)
MSDRQNFLHKPFGFSGYADLTEYRWKATAAILMVYGPIVVNAIGFISLDVATLATIFGLIYTVVWLLPLMVRRGRSAGIHWLASLLLGLGFTLFFAIVLAFLPEKEGTGATPTP